MKEHNDLILELPNFLPDSLCEHLINKFKNDTNKRCGVIECGNEIIIDKTLKNCKEIILHPNNIEWLQEYNQCKKYVEKAMELYKTCLKREYDYNQTRHTFGNMPDCVLKSEDSMSFQCQSRGSKYGWHYDGCIGSQSFLFMIIYLKTLEPHEGGCTEFINGRKIRPERGKIMICPASWTYAHCGNEVKSDYKYTLVTGADIL